MVLYGHAGVRAAEDSPIDMWAQWVVNRGRWKGPTVPYPEPISRPAQNGWVLNSWNYPVSVHAPSTLPYEKVCKVLEATEFIYGLLVETGWPEPYFDGGYGDTPSFDLYLVPGLPELTSAYLDGYIPWSQLDAASTFAVVDADIVGDRLDSCVADAITQAIVLGQDPAEAESWRRAIAAYVAWLISGHFGCDDQVVTAQKNPWQGWISEQPESGAASAIFLAMLSEREDGGSGTFVRELLQFARQNTKDLRRLRGSPDLWEALSQALKNADESLQEIVENLAIARYFAGPKERKRFAPYNSLKYLDDDAQVPISHRVNITELPKHLPVAYPALHVFGSTYTMVDTSSAPLPVRLKIWLRGERGGRWSMTAVRLASDGRELGRMTAPSRRDPNSFLWLELSEGTDKVLIVVTLLSEFLPDADRLDQKSRVFRLIIDRETSASTLPVTIQAE